MQAAGAAPEQLTAVGGGTKSGLWTQITIGASFGDAMLAGAAVGLVPADARWNAPSETLMPDDRARARYDELYGVYRSLYPANSDDAHTIARMQDDAGGDPDRE